MASLPETCSDVMEQMKCAICLDLLKEPKILQCLHTFCKLCLQSTVENGQIICPLCRKPTAVSDTGVETLPSNFLYSRLMEIVEVNNSNCTQEILLNCENCDEKSKSKYFCFDCQNFMCESCRNVHNMLKAIRESHRMQKIESFNEKDLNDFLDRSVYCYLHTREDLKFFCETCDISICRDCAIWNHRTHHYKNIKDAALKEKEEIKSLLQLAEGKALLLHTERETFESKVTRIKNEMDKAAEKIKSAYEVFRQSICQHEQVMIDKLSQKKELFLKDAESERLTFLAKLNKQSDCFQSSRDILESDCWGRVMKVKNNLKKELTENATLEVHQLAPQLPFNSIQYVPSKELLNLLGDLGRISVSSTDPNQCTVEGNGIVVGNVGEKQSITITTRDSAGQVCYSAIDRLSVEIRSSVCEHEIIEPAIEDFENGTYTVTYIPTFVGGYDIKVSIIDEEFGNSPFHIPVDFRPLFIFGGPFGANQRFRKPSGVSANSEGQTAVADFDKNSVQIFDKEGNFLKEITQYFRGGKASKLEGPAGLPFDSVGSLVVVEQAIDRLLVINLHDWNHVRRFGRTGSTNGEFDNPSGISVDYADRIIVSDTNNDRIQVFSSDGKLLLKFGDEGEEKLDSPYYALYHSDRFFVSDTENHCIKVFNNQGEFLYKVGLEGSELGAFNHPSGLAVYQVDMILVCDYHNDRLQLFKLDGTFVLSFGRMGNALGQIGRAHV